MATEPEPQTIMKTSSCKKHRKRQCTTGRGSSNRDRGSSRGRGRGSSSREAARKVQAGRQANTAAACAHSLTATAAAAQSKTRASVKCCCMCVCVFRFLLFSLFFSLRCQRRGPPALKAYTCKCFRMHTSVCVCVFVRVSSS